MRHKSYQATAALQDSRHSFSSSLETFILLSVLFHCNFQLRLTIDCLLFYFALISWRFCYCTVVIIFATPLTNLQPIASRSAHHISLSATEPSYIRTVIPARHIQCASLVNLHILQHPQFGTCSSYSILTPFLSSDIASFGILAEVGSSRQSTSSGGIFRNHKQAARLTRRSKATKVSGWRLPLLSKHI